MAYGTSSARAGRDDTPTKAGSTKRNMLLSCGFLCICMLAGCVSDDPEGESDLQVGEVQFSSDPVIAGDSTAVRIVVNNAGDGPAGRSVLRIAVNGVTATTVDIDELGARSQRAIVIPMVFAAGSQQLQIYADSSGLVDETNETNNVFLVSVLAVSAALTGPG